MSDEEEVGRDYTTEATEQGWREDGPLDAQAFVEKGEKIASIAVSKSKRLEGRIESLEKSNREFGAYHKQTLETQRKKDAGRIADLKGQLAQAITDGDGQAYTKYSTEIDTIKSEQPVPTDDAQAWNQMAQEWAADNKWYVENRKLATYADGLSDQIRAEGYTGKAYFSELTKRTQEDNPEEFSNKNRAKPNSVESGQARVVLSEKKTYDDLPADAKAACDGFVKDGFTTREDYVSVYEFEEGGQ